MNDCAEHAATGRQVQCRNCEQHLKVGQFTSQSILFPGKVLATIEHEDGTLYCGNPFEPWDKRTAQLPEGESRGNN